MRSNNQDQTSEALVVPSEAGDEFIMVNEEFIMVNEEFIMVNEEFIMVNESIVIAQPLEDEIPWEELPEDDVPEAAAEPVGEGVGIISGSTVVATPDIQAFWVHAATSGLMTLGIGVLASVAGLYYLSCWTTDEDLHSFVRYLLGISPVTLSRDAYSLQGFFSSLNAGYQNTLSRIDDEGFCPMWGRR